MRTSDTAGDPADSDRLTPPLEAGGPVNRDTILRLIAMLREIPRDPQRKTTTQIKQALREHNISTRSVQRDLMRLMLDFPFSYEEQGKAYLWFWPAHSKVLDLPSLDISAALAFLLSREHLRPLLTPGTLKQLAPYFNRAEEVLKASPGALAAWRERVCVVTRGPHLESPKIAAGVQDEVYTALLTGKQLQVEYSARYSGETKTQMLNPLGVVVYNGVIYLLATAGEHTNPVSYTLHRMKSAKTLPTATMRPKDFKFHEHARKTFRFPVSDEAFKLVALFDAEVAKHLLERPLAADQTSRAVGDEVEISATVMDSDDLRWWLLGFGEHVEVLKPAKLRAEMRRRVHEMATRYDR